MLQSTEAISCEAKPADITAPLIHEPYVLCCRIALFIDSSGIVYAPLLWARDLERHLEYIKDFRLCCPIYPGDVPPKDRPNDWVAVAGLSKARIFALEVDKGWPRVLANFLPNFVAVWRAVRSADIVHSEMAGWPFPISYYLLLLRPFMAFKWIIIMESSFWMKQVGVRASPSIWRRHHTHLFLSRTCMRQADVRIFTQDWYRKMILGDDHRRAFINEAVWVQDHDVLSEDAYCNRERSGPVRLLFPTRLIAEKGVSTVLTAIAQAEGHLSNEENAPSIIFDIIGAGSMEPVILEFIAQHRGYKIKVSLLAPIPYGASFFEMIGKYDAVVIANLMEEQPRIIYDAFSQGVPCIASRTTGVMQVVGEDGHTAQLFTPGLAPELAQRLAEAAHGRANLAAMGRRALTFARGRTHLAMHRARADYLVKALNLNQTDDICG